MLVFVHFGSPSSAYIVTHIPVRNTGTIINDCYNTGAVNGKYMVGGLIGGNGLYSNVRRCYNVGSVTSDSSYLGGLLGYNRDSGTINSCYWNIETSGLTNGVGIDSGMSAIVGLTTAPMKQASSFSPWNFDTTWVICSDSTYPGLQTIDNAPFAFYDTLISNRTFTLLRLLLNDCDVETARDNLILHITSISVGTTDSVSTLTFTTGIANGTVDTVKYRVGEIRASDTLWGNIAKAYITLDTTYTGVEGNPINNGQGTAFRLEQNKPNPFNQRTTINYQVPKAGQVNLKVYNIAGQVVRTLVNEDKKMGSYEVAWNGRDETGKQVAGGLYFYRLNAAGGSVIKKLVLLK